MFYVPMKLIENFYIGFINCIRVRRRAQSGSEVGRERGKRNGNKGISVEYRRGMCVAPEPRCAARDRCRCGASLRNAVSI